MKMQKSSKKKAKKEFLLSEYEFTILTDDARYEITVGSFGDINGFEKRNFQDNRRNPLNKTIHK